MKINFRLKLISKQKSPVRILLDDSGFDLLDEDTIDIKKELDISPEYSAEQYTILEIQNLQEGIGAKLEINSFCINNIDVDQEEIQDFFSLTIKGNRYANDGLLEKVSEICFNGKLDLIVKKNIGRFFWSPFYSSKKRNDFVYDNRYECEVTYAPPYREGWCIDERIGEKSYVNIPHRVIDEKKKYELGCFGCSVTFGIGLDNDEVWPNLFDKDYLDFSVPGLGVDGIYLNLKNSLEKFQWRNTVIVLPALERKILRFNLPGGYVTRVPVTLNREWTQLHFKQWAWKTFNRQLSEDYRQRWKKIYQKNLQKIVDGTVEKYSKKILLKILKLHEKYERNLYLTSWDEDTYDYLESFTSPKKILPFFDKIDLAKDMMHPGPESHKKWVDQSRSIIFRQKTA